MLGAPSISASLLLQSPMFSKGFHGSLSLASMALTCIPYLLYEKIFLLKVFELYMKFIKRLSFAIANLILISQSWILYLPNKKAQAFFPKPVPILSVVSGTKCPSEP